MVLQDSEKVPHEGEVGENVTRDVNSIASRVVAAGFILITFSASMGFLPSEALSWLFYSFYLGAALVVVGAVLMICGRVFSSHK